jgi:hypothetical protein
MKVYVLVIDHKHGTDVSAYATEEKLNAALFAYCDQWWDREYGSEDRPPNNKLVTTYWERMSIDGDEWHVIEECEI